MGLSYATASFNLSDEIGTAGVTAVNKYHQSGVVEFLFVK